MAASGYVIKDPTIYIDTHDVSDLVREVTVHREYADVDATGARSDGAMEHKHGLRNDSFTIVAKSTFGAAGLDSILEDLFENEEEFEVTVNPHALPTTTDNPQYQGTCILLTYEPITGQIGALSTASLNLPCQGRIAKVTS